MENINIAFQVYDNKNDYEGKLQCANMIANTMVNYSNFTLADKYFEICLLIIDSVKSANARIAVINDIGRMYNYKMEYDSALMYFKKARAESVENNSIFLEGISASNIGEIYMKQEIWEKSQAYNDEALKIFEKINLGIGIFQQNSLLAYINYRQGKIKKSKSFQAKAEYLLKSIQVYLSLLKDYYQRTFEIKQGINDYKAAFENLHNYQKLQDSVSNTITNWKVNELETRLMTSIKEKQLAKKKEQLEEEKRKNEKMLFRSILITSILLFLTVILLYYRKNEKKLFEIRQNLLIEEHEKGTLQMQLMMACNRLSPHLIANVFLDIRQQIEKQDKNKALALLNSISKLVLYSFTHTETITVTIEKEIEFVENYINVRKPALGNYFSYDIDIEEKTKQVEIPSMIIQLVVENAIKHGLMRKNICIFQYFQKKRS